MEIDHSWPTDTPHCERKKEKQRAETQEEALTPAKPRPEQHICKQQEPKAQPNPNSYRPKVGIPGTGQDSSESDCHELPESGHRQQVSFSPEIPETAHNSKAAQLTLD
jgi:hypothetical protein